jgi:hypothetical protein
MSVSTYTNEVMKALPAGIRPNPWNIDEHVMTAVENGWTPLELVATALSNKVDNPGLFVHHLRRISLEPAPNKPTDTRATGPCQLGCAYGWFDKEDGSSTSPCPSCRPDTHRRLTLREEARTRGASLHTQYELMSTDTRDMAKTYPLTQNKAGGGLSNG